MKKKDDGKVKKVELELVGIVPGVLVLKGGEKSSKAGYTSAYSRGYGSINWGAKPSVN